MISVKKTGETVTVNGDSVTVLMVKLLQQAINKKAHRCY